MPARLFGIAEKGARWHTERAEEEGFDVRGGERGLTIDKLALALLQHLPQVHVEAAVSFA